ncbi:MAG: RNA methyltransferase [Synechococcaceae cyanobacterium]|nr:RNA methyltransferase [Synechococcaceae cyanobacterium]
MHEARGRREQGLLLVEGTHLLQEVLRLQLQPRLLLATPRWCERHPALLASLPAALPRRLLSEEALQAAASTEHPDGVLLTLAPPPPPDGALKPGFVLALDRLQDPGNLGTLLRTALAAGVEEVWLGEGADPWQPKVLRASSGAALALPLRRLEADSLQQRLRQAAGWGLQRLAAVVAAPAAADAKAIGAAAAPAAAEAPAAGQPGRPYWELDWTRPTLLLLGNEGSGLDPRLLALADQAVTIPHAAAVESLNVAVAAAPLLLERWRQRLVTAAPAAPSP